MARFKRYSGLSAFLLIAILMGWSEWSPRDAWAQLSRSAGVIPVHFYLELARGTIPGYSSINKFGENPDIDSSTFEDIWDAGGQYVPPTQARLHDVASTLAADAGTIVSSGTLTGGSINTIVDTSADFVSDGVAAGDVVLNDANVALGDVLTVDDLNTITVIGTMVDPNTGERAEANAVGEAYRIVRDEGVDDGVSILHILGLDASFLEQEEFVVLNGTTDVATTKSYIRQFRGRSFSSAGPNTLGTVTSTAQVDGTLTMQIAGDNNQTLMTIYTCPADKTCYIVKWNGNMSRPVAAATSEIRLRGGTIDGIGYSLQPRSTMTTGDSGFDYTYVVPIPIPGGSDIWVEANSNAQNVGVASVFEILKKDN